MRKSIKSVLAMSAAVGLLAACSGGGSDAADGDATAEESAEAQTYDNGIEMFPGVDAASVQLGGEGDERTAEFTLDGTPFRAIDHYGPVFTANGWENSAGTFDSQNDDASQWLTLNAATGSDGTVRVTVGAKGVSAEGDTFENGLPAYPNVVEGSVNSSAGAGDLQNVTFDTTDTVLSVMNFYAGAFEELGVPNRMMVYTAGNQGAGPGGRVTVNRTNTVRITYHGGQ